MLYPEHVAITIGDEYLCTVGRVDVYRIIHSAAFMLIWSPEDTTSSFAIIAKSDIKDIADFAPTREMSLFTTMCPAEFDAIMALMVQEIAT